MDIPQAQHDIAEDDGCRDVPSENAQQQQPTPPTVFAELDLVRPVLPDDGDAPCLGEVLYYMFEWMARNKSTDKAASTAWAMLAEVLPPENFPRRFAYLKKILEKYVAGKVRTIHLCPNGHIAYYNSTSAPLFAYQHAKKQKCPQCGVSRYVTVMTRHGLRRRPRAKMYYLGVEQYFQDLFRQPDLAAQLDYTHGGKFPGSVKLSRGFHQKVLSNPLLNKEGRNQAVIATADGIPLFKDMSSRKGHPFMLRPANGNEGLQKDLYKAHLFGYIPCETWDVDENHQAIRQVGSPSSLQPMMFVFADEMYKLYHSGAWIEDFSRPSTDPGRRFRMRVILLFLIGDYPGLAELTDFWSMLYAYTI